MLLSAFRQHLIPHIRLAWLIESAFKVRCQFLDVISVRFWQQSIKEMLQDMTDLLVNVSSRRDVMELLYLEAAETNLIYALGKYIQASSRRSGTNKTVSNSFF